MVSGLLRAYTAGLLDGEGSIQINPGNKKKSGKRYFSMAVSISSNCKEVLEYLQKQWNLGRVKTWKSKNAVNRSYVWRIYAHDAEILLKQIEKFLIIKRANALLALQFRQCVGYTKNNLPLDIAQKRSKIALEMRELNKKYSKNKNHLKSNSYFDGVT